MLYAILTLSSSAIPFAEPNGRGMAIGKGSFSGGVPKPVIPDFATRTLETPFSIDPKTFTFATYLPTVVAGGSNEPAVLTLTGCSFIPRPTTNPTALPSLDCGADGTFKFPAVRHTRTWGFQTVPSPPSTIITSLGPSTPTSEPILEPREPKIHRRSTEPAIEGVPSVDGNQESPLPDSLSLAHWGVGNGKHSLSKASLAGREDAPDRYAAQPAAYPSKKRDMKNLLVEDNDVVSLDESAEPTYWPPKNKRDVKLDAGATTS